MAYEDILYEVKDNVAKITINRPEKFNAFTRWTLYELVQAFVEAGDDPAVGVVVLTGAGEKAFCSGGDVEWEARGFGGGWGPKVDIFTAIATCPKPTIARVNGVAIAGGNVMQVCCDLAIASEKARFGQAGPRVGSFNAAFGTSYLARLVGERKAREMWFLCRQYKAPEALEMGLVNAVVPADQLDAEVDQWCSEILALSPSALTACKNSFLEESAPYIGRALFGAQLTGYIQSSPEAREGQTAFVEKRKPDFSQFRKK
ncbi:MAG: enoyl-CoA hydratase-related protein [Dehalococcoidia bacterium]